MASNRGRFVNTFSSMQMLGGYEEGFDSGEEANETGDIFSLEENNLKSSHELNIDTNLNEQSSIATKEPLPGNNEDLLSNVDDPLSNGDDLYNPLDDMDVASDNEDNNMELSTSPLHNIESFENNPQNDNSFNNSLTKFGEKPEDVIFPEIDKQDHSNVSSQEEQDEGKEEEEDIPNSNELNNTSSQESLVTTKTSEKSSDDVDLIGDVDELLGTALAELEQEEQEKQVELEKLISLEKDAIKDRKSRKKKKKAKDKSEDKESKKKRKKKEKKKRKAKDKDPDSVKKKKKSKEKRDSELGIDELLERIKEEEEKEHSRKHSKKPKNKSLKKDPEDSESLTKETKQKEKQEKIKDRKSIEHKKSISPSSEKRHHSRDSHKTSTSIERKHDSKDIHKQSPTVDRRRDSKDARKRSASPDRKHDHRLSPSTDRKHEKRRDSKDEKRKHRKRSKSIEKRHSKDDNKDHSSRKRTSKEPAPDFDNKRLRGDSPLENHLRRSRKNLDVSKSKDQDKKKSHRPDSSEESELQKNHKTTGRRLSEKEQKVSHEKDRLDYEIKVPDRTHENKNNAPPKLSKEEFYQLQHSARKHDKDSKPIENVSEGSSGSSSSESDSEVQKALHRSSFNENYSSELNKFRIVHKVDAKKSTNTSNEISYSDTHSNKRKENSRRDSGSNSFRHKSHSPNNNSLQNNSSYNHDDSIKIKRRRSISENNNSLLVNVSESTSITKQFLDISEDNASIDDVPTLDLKTSDNESLKISTSDIQTFDTKPNEENRNNSFRHTESISSISDTEGSLEISDEKPSKPGSLSLRQYKERRKSGRKHRYDRHSSERHMEISEAVETKEPVSNIETLDRENKENLPYAGHISPEQNSNNINLNNDYAESESNLYNGKQSIPLLFEDKLQNSSQSLGSEIDMFDTTTGKEDDSPYNPEAASPLDMASPSVAAIEDRDDVDFSAYKDVVAYEDIMKSKVKHEARKHQKRKQEELKAEFGSPPADSKEGNLVDYLVRQAQVEEEMKNVLKSYFKSREITKDEYKDILKKAVPQVTMSNSPIVPEKIHSLMTKFVRKCKGNRAKEDKQRRREQKQLAEQQKQLQLQLKTSAAMFQQIRVLNPNLPMPPM